MPISYKNKIYTTLGTPATLSGGIVSATDSAGVPTKDYTIKGKTVVWNQLFNKNSTPNLNDTAIAYSVDGNSNIFNTTSGTTTSHPYFNFLCNTIANHKYMICAESLKWSSATHSGLFVGDEANPDNASYATLTSNDLAKFFTATNETCYIKAYISYTAGNYEFIMNALQLFDLTQMFGAGNEPTTPAEFRAMFPDDYYTYNAGELKTIVPISIEASGVERFQLLDKSKYPATVTKNGVTFTNNGDGSITVNGTATSGSGFRLDTFYIEGNRTYLMIGCPEGGGAGKYFMFDGYSKLGSDLGSGIIKTVSGSDRTLCSPILYVVTGQTVSNLVFKPQIFDLTEMYGAGNEPTTVEQFRQDFPEEMYNYSPHCWLTSYKRVFMTGGGNYLTSYQRNLTCKTKNLLSFPYHSSYVTKNGITFSQVETYKVHASGINTVSTGITFDFSYNKVFKAGTYTIKFYTEGSVSPELYYRIRKDSYYGGTIINDKESQKTFTLSEDTILFISFGIYGTGSPTYTGKKINVNVWCQIELGSTVTDYVPYGHL